MLNALSQSCPSWCDPINCELLAMLELNCRKGNGIFLCAFDSNDNRLRICLNVKGSYGRGKEVKKVAQGCSSLQSFRLVIDGGKENSISRICSCLFTCITSIMTALELMGAVDPVQFEGP